MTEQKSPTGYPSYRWMEYWLSQWEIKWDVPRTPEMFAKKEYMNSLIFLFSCFTESVIRKSLLFHALRLHEISCSFGGELKRRSLYTERFLNAVKWYTLTPSHFVFRTRKICTVPVWQKILFGFSMKMVSALNLTNAETNSTWEIKSFKKIWKLLNFRNVNHLI